MDRIPQPAMTPRRGIALPATLMVLALLLLVTVGGSHVALGAIRRGNDARRVAQATAAADAGAYAALRDWALAPLDSLSPGDSMARRVSPAGDAVAITQGVRLSQSMWWIVGTGFVPDTIGPRSARRDVRLLVRKDVPEWLVDAALSVADSVVVTGSGLVDGTDSTAALAGGRSCALAPGAGVAAPDTAAIVGGNILGAPPRLTDSRSGTLSVGVGTAWGALRANALRLPAPAVVTPAPVVIGSRCDLTVSTNWGEPNGTGPCAGYTPVIHVAGDVELRGGRGQGVLIADGDVRIAGGAQFDGVIVAGDDLTAGPGGGTVLGAVIARDQVRAAGDFSRIGDGLTIRRSSCLVAAVLSRVAPPIVVRARAWAELP